MGERVIRLLLRALDRMRPCGFERAYWRAAEIFKAGGRGAAAIWGGAVYGVRLLRELEAAAQEKQQ